MRQPEKFICISYSKIDFLIPNDYVVSAVGVKDVQMGMMHNENSGIVDFDDLATRFNQYPRPTHVKTMILIKDDTEEQVYIVTTQECKVCTISLNEFSLFSECYSEAFKQFGILACNFEENRMRLLIDVKQMIDYSNGDMLLEEL